jgi:hypothetical protein
MFTDLGRDRRCSTVEVLPIAGSRIVILGGGGIAGDGDLRQELTWTTCLIIMDRGAERGQALKYLSQSRPTFPRAL